MTNYERWRLFMENIHAPDDYLDIGFYYMIAAALQRRVWLGDLSSPVFPNMYVLLVGPAGVGKGLTTGPVTAFLTHHKYMPGSTDPNGVQLKTPLEEAVDAAELMAPGRASENEKMLFEVAPDSGSFEALVKRMSKASRPAKFLGPDGRIKPYAHASMHVALDEFTSIFKRHAEDTVSFFLTVWGEKRSYERETIGRGRESILHPCLSMIAGTTPENLKKLTEIDVVGTGLSRRIVMVWAERNRYEQMFIPPRTEEQNKARVELLTYLRTLSRVCGPVVMAPDAREYLSEWWSDKQARRACKSPLVDDYEANRAIHVQKMAIAFHYADQRPDNVITLDTARRALEFMQRIDAKRDRCLEHVGRNPLSTLSRRVAAFIKQSGHVTRGELLAMFYSELQQYELEEILSALRERGEIEQIAHPKKGLGYARRKLLPQTT